MTLNTYRLGINFRFLSPVLASGHEKQLLLLEPTVSIPNQKLDHSLRATQVINLMIM